MTVLLAIPYLRTSTDDKGQDPLRQMLPIRAWAATKGALLTEPIVDEGTSGALTGPFERPRFLEAIERAKSAKGVISCIVLETPDRLTREGSDECSWVKMELRKRHGIELYFADEIADRMGDRLLRAVKSEAAANWWEDHRKKIVAGMKRKGPRPGERKPGWGAPPKPLTPEEVEYAVSAYRPPGPGRFGWRKVAHEINRRRGVLDIMDPAVRRRKGVSGNHVKRWCEPLLPLNNSNAQKVPLEAEREG